MRTLCLVLMMCLLPAGGMAAELMSTADAERQANLDAAEARKKELEQIIDNLDTSIAELEGRAVLPGKKAGERTTGKIVNGLSTGAYPTAGAFIKGFDAASAGSHCTGTLIGRTTFLTAAHCVQDDPDPAVYHVFLQHGGIFAVDEIHVHPDFQFPHADLVVVRLASAVNGIRPTALNTAAVPPGSEGDIVGYGRAGGFNFDYGIKRVGKVRVAGCDPGRPPSLVCWNFDDPVGAAGLDSNTCNADSGGPLYIQRAQDDPMVLAGVTSGGSQMDCLAGDRSYDVDVAQFADWIIAQTNDDLSDCCSGDLPPWGGDKVQTLRAEVDFAATLRARTYTLSVPDDIEMLRVAMNGHDQDGRDFNLFVKKGDSVSTTDSDCARDGSGQYAFCEFADPDQGDWTILVDAKAGNGIAQVSATLFEE